MSHPLAEVFQHASLVVSKLGHDTGPVVHLLLQGEVPEVPVLFVYLAKKKEGPRRQAGKTKQDREIEE